MDEKLFDEMYGEGAHDRVRAIINDLAPVTRRDEWWATDGPYEILAKHLLPLDSKTKSPTDRAST